MIPFSHLVAPIGGVLMVGPMLAGPGACCWCGRSSCLAASLFPLGVRAERSCPN